MVFSSIIYTIIFIIYFNFNDFSKEFQKIIIIYFLINGFFSIYMCHFYLLKKNFFRKILILILKMISVYNIFVGLEFFNIQVSLKLSVLIVNILLDFNRKKDKTTMKE
jgi:hypothetical protein